MGEFMPHSKKRNETERLRETIATLKMQVQALEQAMQHVEREEDRFLYMFFQADLPLYVKNIRGQWLFVNHALCRLFGLTRSDIQGKSAAELFDSDCATIVRERDEQVLQTGQGSCYLEYYQRQGQSAQVRILRSFYQDPSSGAIFLPAILQTVSGTVIDAREQQAHLEAMLQTCGQRLSKMNETLEKENQRRRYIEELLTGLQQAFQNGPVVLLRWGAEPNWPVEFVSDSIRIFGFSPTYFNTQAAYRPLIHPLDVKRVEAHLQHFVASNDTLCEQRYRLLDGNGIIRWIYDFRTARRDVRGQVTHYQGYIVDVTEQTRTAGVLRHIEARFGSLVSMLPYTVLELDSNGIIISANEASTSLLGYSVAELENLCLWSLLASEEAQIHLAEKLAHTGSGSYQTLLQRKDRVPVHVQLDWNAMRNHNGKIGGYVMVMADINHWQQLVTSLEESGARFQHLMECSPALLWMASANYNMSYLSKAWCEFSGLARDQALGQGWIAHLHPDDLNDFKSAYNSAFIRRQNISLSIRLRRHDGVYRWLYWFGIPHYNPEQHFTGYIGVCTDISPVKRAQQQAEQHTQMFTNLMQHFGIGLSVIRTDGTCIFINNTACIALGLAQNISTQALYSQLSSTQAGHIRSLVEHAHTHGKTYHAAAHDVPALHAVALDTPDTVALLFMASDTA
jgi:PAS domain S-box-containing protein